MPNWQFPPLLLDPPSHIVRPAQLSRSSDRDCYAFVLELNMARSGVGLWTA